MCIQYEFWLQHANKLLALALISVDTHTRNTHPNVHYILIAFAGVRAKSVGFAT